MIERNSLDTISFLSLSLNSLTHSLNFTLHNKPSTQFTNVMSSFNLIFLSYVFIFSIEFYDALLIYCLLFFWIEYFNIWNLIEKCWNSKTLTMTTTNTSSFNKNDSIKTINPIRLCYRKKKVFGLSTQFYIQLYALCTTN